MSSQAIQFSVPSIKDGESQPADIPQLLFGRAQRDSLSLLQVVGTRPSAPRQRTVRMSELENTSQNTPNYIELAADIVSAFVSNNSVPVSELPALIGSVHEALNRIASDSTQQSAEEVKAPAVPIKKSVQPDYIVCLEDGKRFKSLKRQLPTRAVQRSV